jgi:hypothetical protein
MSRLKLGIQSGSEKQIYDVLPRPVRVRFKCNGNRGLSTSQRRAIPGSKLHTACLFFGITMRN